MAGRALVLASTSPRRRQLLAEAGYSFEVLDPGPDGPSEAHDPAARVLDHARHKVHAGARARPDAVVLASDTLVWCAGHFLAKPSDRAAARAMLEALSGGEHEVWTGVAVAEPGGGRHEAAVQARVAFETIPEAELEAYLAGDEWRDKAGAYGIQGTAGRWARLVAGTFDTVVGLPIETVQRLLAAAGACPKPPAR